MDVIVFDSRELPIALGAIRAVVAQPSPAQERYLEVLAGLHGAPLQAMQIAPVSSERVGAVIRAAHKRGRLVQLAVVMTMVDGEVQPEPVAAVTALAEALGVEDGALEVLPHLVAKHAFRTRVLVMRRIMRKMLRDARRSEGMAGVYKIFSALWGFGYDRASAKRFDGLQRYPAGSLGRALWDHCRSNGFKLPGERGGIPARLIFHDVGHLLSGYSTKPEGEIQQAAFQAGFVRVDGFAFLFFGIIQFHLGIKITPVAAAEVGYFDVEKVMTALARGAACKHDLADNWDFWSAAARPLSQVRSELDVSPPPPVVPERAVRAHAA